MKKTIVVPAVLLLLGGAFVTAWQMGWFGREDSRAQELVLYGNVDIRQVGLGFLVTEKIDRLLVEEGDAVTAGQLLAELDTSRLRQQVEGAKARVRAQEKVLERLLAGTRQEEIQQARAEMEGARVQAVNARKRALRFQELLRSGSVSDQEADDAVSGAEAAEARLAAAREVYQLALAGPRQEDIDEARAGLDAQRSELDLALQEMEYAFLSSPGNGTIQQRLLERGDVASPQNPVFTLALNDPVWVRVFVDEPDLGLLKPGMTAWVTTDSFPDKRYQGWIGYISPTAEFTPKSVQTEEIRTQLVYQVRVYVQNPQGELRLGMPATVSVPL
ncbi:MAG: efflux RND transporter periplasmic adaptor subunit, partial [Desulfohalobiaceae bacterium]